MKNHNTPNNQKRLAKAFCFHLHNYLGPSLVGKAAARNRRDRNKPVCHTNDFCDGNQIMLYAFMTCRLPDPSSKHRINDDNTMYLWAKAWNMAKAAEFKAELI